MKKTHSPCLAVAGTGFNERADDDFNESAACCINDNGKNDAPIRIHNKRENAQTRKTDTGKNVGSNNADTVADFIDEVSGKKINTKLNTEVDDDEQRDFIIAQIEAVLKGQE